MYSIIITVVENHTVCEFNIKKSFYILVIYAKILNIVLNH